MSSDPPPLPAIDIAAAPLARPLGGPGWPRVGLVALCLCGLAISVLLLRLAAPAPLTILGSQVCPPRGSVNCDYVLASRWARVGPVPAAALGVAYFGQLALWFTLVGIPNVRGRRWHVACLAVMAAGLCISMFYVYVMAARLPVWCTWCLAAHVVNALAFVLAWWARPLPAGSALDGLAFPRPSTGRAIGVLATGLLGIAALAMGSLAWQWQTVARMYQLELLKAVNNPEYILWRYREESPRQIPIREDDCTVGRPDAPYRVVVFSDFECPNCAGLHRYLGRLVRVFPESVCFVTRHYPLSGECNPHAASGGHLSACRAAIAAECARVTGTPKQFYAYERALYAGRLRPDAAFFEELAVTEGLDRQAWRMSIGAPAAARRVEEDVALAHELGVDAAPALFLNGRRLRAWSILTTGPSPVVDLEATDALWAKLLHVPAPRSTTGPHP
jgi:protein-disulfide isomerase/uncharacterized membrane protein